MFLDIKFYITEIFIQYYTRVYFLCFMLPTIRFTLRLFIPYFFHISYSHAIVLIFPLNISSIVLLNSPSMSNLSYHSLIFSRFLIFLHVSYMLPYLLLFSTYRTYLSLRSVFFISNIATSHSCPLFFILPLHPFIYLSKYFS